MFKKDDLIDLNKSVLFLGGGRRYELALHFIVNGWRIYATELEPRFSPLMKLPRNSIVMYQGIEFEFKNSIKFNSTIRFLVDNNNIDLVVPLMDSASWLYSLEFFNDEYMLSKFPIKTFTVAEMSYDKLVFEQAMKENFDYIYPSVESGEKVIKKPINGHSSLGIKKLTYSEYETVKKNGYVFQKYVDGEEYSVDAYFDCISKKFIDCVVRTRDRIGYGEVIISKSVHNPQLIYLTKIVGETFGVTGPCNFQFIVKDNKPYLIEINSRFGGGSTFSIQCGLDFITYLENNFKKNIENKPVKNLEAHEGFKLVRSSRDHVFRLTA